MRVLITGGAGFIGSHLAELLLTQGHEVTVLDDLSTGSLGNIQRCVANPRFAYTIGSATDDAVVGPLIDRVDTVFHLAAAVGVKLVVDAPVHTIRTNVHGTETVLRHAAPGRKRVIVVSTSEVYGKSAILPFREDADLVVGPPTKTRWGYATSKLIDEFLALGYWKEQQLPVTVVRLFNTVGPRQSSRYGMVVPNFVRRALRGEALQVHGDGTQTRSFTWVGDVVWALVRLAAEPTAVGEVFNIGNDREISVRDLAGMVKTMTYSRSPITFVPYDQVFDASFEDMPRRVPDITKIGRFIGYRPTVQLPQIIEQVVEYWSNERPSARRTVGGVLSSNAEAIAPTWHVPRDTRHHAVSRVNA